MLPTTEIFAFSAPKIKGGELHIAVNTGAGSLHVLRATRSVWANLAGHLREEFFPKADKAPDPTAYRPRLRGAEREQVYGEVLERVQLQGLTHIAACNAASVSYTAFQSWLAQRRSRGIGVGMKNPILKPGGKLL